MKDLQGEEQRQGAASLARLLMGALKLERITRLYDKYADKDREAFIDAVLQDLGIDLSIPESDFAHIPKSGGFVAVANHPLGGIDGLVLLKALSKVRPDVKVMANFLLTTLDPINDAFISVDPFAGRQRRNPGDEGFRLAKAHVKSGGALVVFPAGDVSTYNFRTPSVRDKLWQPSALHFIKSLGVPVQPVFIKASNTLFFHLLGLVNPRLKAMALPLGLLGKREKDVTVRLGRPVSPADQEDFMDLYEYGRFLRIKTYLLGQPGIKVKPFFRPVLFRKKWKEVVLPRNAEALQREVQELELAGQLLFQTKEYQVYWATSEAIPNVLYEIGRLREITFREVGEGTGKNIDLDQYDLYYRHLFIWDSEQLKVVGAYRLGMGKEILQRYGKKGFYLNSLFKLKKGFKPILDESIELGRSFVVKEYQLKPLSLFMLWKGILYYILKNPEYRYLIGPVSISGEFSKFSKYLIISFIRTHYFDKELAALVEPRNEYIPEVDPNDPDVQLLHKSTREDIKRLDRIVEEIELGNFRLPALLKKYLGQNARIIAFNVDPNFNNALDGLLVMDLFNVPMETFEGLAKEMGDKEILQKFAAAQELAIQKD
jgi:putative hemolysin